MPGRLALTEARNRHILTLFTIYRRDCFFKGFAVYLYLKLIAVCLYLVRCFQTHSLCPPDF